MTDFVLGLMSGLLIASFGAFLAMLLKILYDRHTDGARARQRFYLPLGQTLQTLRDALSSPDFEKNLVRLASLFEFVVFKLETLVQYHGEYYSRLGISYQQKIFSLMGLVRFSRDKELGTGKSVSADSKSELMRVSSDLIDCMKKITDSDG